MRLNTDYYGDNEVFKKPGVNEHCVGCVYYPPNLPPNAYPTEDYQMLQEKSCSFDFQPRGDDCNTTRKTSCSLVDLKNLKQYA